MIQKLSSDILAERIGTLFPREFTEGLAVSNVGYWLWDVKQDVFEVSQSMLHLTGRPELNFATRREFLEELMHPDDMAQVLAATSRLLNGRRSYETLTRMKHTGGHYVWASTKAILVRTDGAPHYVIGFINIMDDLARSKRDIVLAEDLAGLGTWSVNLINDKVTWSRGAFRIHGLDPDGDAPTIKFIRNLWAKGDRERIIQIIEEALKINGAFEYRVRLPQASGRDKTVKVNGAVELGISGTPVSYYGTYQDITAEVERDQKLRQSQKLESIGQLTGGVAHDFNNLLAVILGNLELLSDEDEPAKQKDLINLAIEATLRGADLTKNLLSFARKAPLTPEALDLNKVVRGAKNWVERTLPESIQVETSLLAGLWPIQADRASLESALLNLVLNARHAMAEHGNLTIETANVRIDQAYIVSRQEELALGRYVMLAVSDTGPGIDPEIIDSIFEPFFTTKAPGLGSGLGLSMIVGFMKQSGGTAQVYTEVGVGTTFKLFFPAATEPAAEAHEPTDARPIAAGGARKLLVAEDEEAVRKTLVKTLECAGYNVASAASGDEALAIFEANPSFDMLLTDIVMPGKLQGTTLAKTLRERWPDLPVVFMSGYASEATVHGNGLKPQDIRLMKPVQRADLIEAVGNGLRPAKN
jgi:PAS domain S-box-containing protein